MDARKFIVNFVALLLFTFYFTALTQKYLRYETITDVDLVTRRSDLPPMDNFLAMASFRRQGKPGPTRGNIKRFTVNGRKVNLSNDTFLKLGTINWKMSYEEKLEDEVFEVETISIPRMLPIFIVRVLQGTGRHESPNALCPLQRSWIIYRLEMFVLNLSPPPYDTNCGRYSVSQINCLTSCLNATKIVINETRSTEKRSLISRCFTDCERKNCLAIFFAVTVARNPSLAKLLTIIFAVSNTLSIKSTALFDIFLYVQQTFGIIAIFFEFVVLDLLHPFTEFIQWLDRRLKRKRVRDSQIFHVRDQKCVKNLKWKRFKQVMVAMIVSCFITHTSIIMGHYFEYRTSSETFFGEPTTQYVPTVAVCSRFNGSNYSMISDMRTLTPDFNGTLNILFPTTFGAPSIESAFRGNQKCFISSESVGPEQNVSDAVVLIMSKRKVQFDAAFSLTETIPRNHPQIEATIGGTVKYQTQVFSYQSLPSPYPTGCVDYKTIGYDSKADCRARCVERNFHEKYNSHPLEYLTKEIQNLTRPVNESEAEIMGRCGSTCSWNECINLQFIIGRPVGATRSPSPTVILLGQKYMKSVTIIPEQSVTEFVTFVANLLSFWVGSCRILALKSVKPLRIKRVKVFKSVVYLMLAAGFLYHMSMLMSHYFTYEMVTSVLLGIPETLMLPSVSLLMIPNDQTIPNKLLTTDNCSLLGKLSPVELNKKFVDLRSMIKQISIFDPETFEAINIEKEILANYTHDYVYSCCKLVTLDFGSFKPQYYRYKHFEVSFRKKILLRINFRGKLRYKYERDNNVTDSSFRHVILHSHSYRPVRTGEMTFRYVAAIAGSNTLRTKLLPQPFATSCTKYRNPLSHQDSWFNCIIDENLKKYGAIPNMITAPASLNYTRRATNYELHQKCIKKFKSAPCESVHYETRIITRGLLTRNGDIFVLPPHEETRCEFVPRMPFLDMTIYMAEILDIWLGINMYFLLSKLGRIDRYIKLKLPSQ